MIRTALRGLRQHRRFVDVFGRLRYQSEFCRPTAWTIHQLAGKGATMFHVDGSRRLRRISSPARLRWYAAHRSRRFNRRFGLLRESAAMLGVALFFLVGFPLFILTH